jgi:hypothetical protein
MSARQLSIGVMAYRSTTAYWSANIGKMLDVWAITMSSWRSGLHPRLARVLQILHMRRPCTPGRLHAYVEGQYPLIESGSSNGQDTPCSHMVIILSVSTVLMNQTILTHDRLMIDPPPRPDRARATINLQSALCLNGQTCHVTF